VKSRGSRSRGGQSSDQRAGGLCSFDWLGVLSPPASAAKAVRSLRHNGSSICPLHVDSPTNPRPILYSIDHLCDIKRKTSISNLPLLHTITMFRRVLATAPAQVSRAIQSSSRPTTASFARAITPAVQTSRRSYHEKVLDHYNNPRNVGSMGKNEQDVGTGLVGAPACGDVMKIQIKVDPNNETITDVKFKTFGCGSAIASSSYLTELVKGMTLEQAGRIRNTEIAKELCLPPVKRKFFMLYRCNYLDRG